MAARTEPVFRLRFCRGDGCRSPFWICRSCDRGHRYCSVLCRQRNRRRQLREANRRYQRSPEGKLDHRDRQRAYRQRQRRAGVTDQGRRQTSPSASLSRVEGVPRSSPQVGEATNPFPRRRLPFVAVPRCAICGRSGSHIEPFANGG